jgi:D-alanyl-D-alanine carboxypeptidase (penicillin-binding protein 5/6)
MPVSVSSPPRVARFASAALLLAALLLPTLRAQGFLPPPPPIAAKSWVLLDARTGQVLAAHNRNEHLPQASLTKLMVAYITFAALKAHTLSLNTRFTISTAAWRTGGSRMFLTPGSHVSVNDLLLGLIVDSGNDASVALAQGIAGSRAGFVALMNRYARRLGLKNTHYMNVDGLPAPGHYSSALDVALMSRDIIRTFPALYRRYFAVKSFTWDHITQYNRVTLLWSDASVDGLKTGYTKEAGYCMDASAHRHGMRLIAVVMGAASESARAREAEALLNYGFSFYRDHRLYAAGQAIRTIPVWLGDPAHAAVVVHRALWATVPRGHYREVRLKLVLLRHLRAPWSTARPVGRIGVWYHGNELTSRALYLARPVARAGWWTRLFDRVGRWL